MNTERDAFEAWCRDTNLIDWSRDKTSESNEYHKPYTQRAWLAWQAAVQWAAKIDAGVLLSEENDRLIDEIKCLREAVRAFTVHATYPVSIEINPRGYAWRGEEALEYAKTLADAALSRS